MNPEIYTLSPLPLEEYKKERPLKPWADKHAETTLDDLKRALVKASPEMTGWDLDWAQRFIKSSLQRIRKMRKDPVPQLVPARDAIYQLHGAAERISPYSETARIIQDKLQQLLDTVEVHYYFVK